jgi:hypothetical protein
MNLKASGITAVIKGKQVFTWILTLFLITGCGTPSGFSANNSYYQISGGSHAGALTIERIQLNFPQGLNSITVREGDIVSPTAVIKYQGRGVLTAQWLVDDRIIEQVNLSLNRGSVLNISPMPSSVVPSFAPGNHSIRFNIQQPAINFKQPKITYFVTST